MVHTTSIEEICLSLCFLQAPTSKVLLGKTPAVFVEKIQDPKSDERRLFLFGEV